MFFKNKKYFYKKNLQFFVALFLIFMSLFIYSIKIIFDYFDKGDIDAEFALYEQYVESYIDTIKDDVILAADTLKVKNFSADNNYNDAKNLFDVYLKKKNCPDEIYLFDNNNNCVLSVGNDEKMEEALKFISDNSVLDEVYISDFFLDKYNNNNHVFFGKSIIADNLEFKLLFCYDNNNFKNFVMNNNSGKIFSVLLPTGEIFADYGGDENEFFSHLDFMELSKILKLRISNNNFSDGENGKFSLDSTRGNILINYKTISSPNLILISVEKDNYLFTQLIFYLLGALIIFSAFALLLYLRQVCKFFSGLKKIREEVDGLDLTFNKINITKVGIEDIDLYLDKILKLCDSYKKIFFDIKKVFVLFNTNVGVIERFSKEGFVLYSPEIADIVGSSDFNTEDDVGRISIEDFFKFKNTNWSDFEEEENVYCVQTGNSKKWIKVLNYDENETKYIVIDVSKYIVQKYKNIFNSDFDYITGFMTKDVFMERVSEFIDNNKLSFGCFASLELSYYSTICDAYGEYVSDEYLRMAAFYFSEFFDGFFIGVKNKGEFMTFIYSEDTKDNIEKKLTQWESAVSQNIFVAPDGKKFRLKFMVGYACYPSDSGDLDTLLKYSVFALYETKRLYKKSVHFFSIENYNRDMFLEIRTKELDKLIDENKAKYHFQPIINVMDCSIYGYEALLRTDNDVFSTPIDIINLALTEGKAYLVEKMNILNCMEIVKKNKSALLNRRIFINSIATNSLTEEDLRIIRNNYGDVRHLFIYELSTLFADNITVINKCDVFKKIGVKYGIDRFWGKHTDDELLSSITPEFIKIDKSIISDIHLKKEKQSRVTRLVKYANENNINLIAVGVETYDELVTVMKLGIKFVQGFYVALPRGEFIDEIGENLKKKIAEIRSHL